MSVSVIVPVYNGAEYIDKCLSSLLNQKTNIDYEIIVVNDGSKDESRKILDSYESDKLRCFHRENHGVSLTRRFGAEQAKGEFLMFVDVDDYVRQDYIEKMLENATEGYMPFCTCLMEYKDRKKIDTSVASGKYNYEESIDMIVNAKLMATYWRTLFEKEKFLSIEMNTLKYCEDVVFIMEYLTKFNMGINLFHEPVYFYNCTNVNSATSNFYTVKYVDSFLRIPFLVEKIFSNSKGKINVDKYLSIELVLSMIRSFRIVDYKSFKAIFNDNKYNKFRSIKLKSCDRWPHKIYFLFFKIKFYLPIFMVEYTLKRNKNRRKKVKYDL